MAKTLQNVIDRVRTITGDKTAAQFTDADIARWATDGQLQVVRAAETAQTDWNGVSVAAQWSYPVVGGFLLVRDVFYDGTKLIRKTREELNDINPSRLTSPATATGVPDYFWLERDTVLLYPTPSVSGKVIVARIVPRPADLTVPADTLTIPDEYMETVVRYCLQMAGEWGEDWTAAAYFKTDVRERKAEDAYLQQVQGSDTYPSVREAPGENW